MTNHNKLKVCILGSGNIGTDLLIKIMRSEHLTCSLFAGRTNNSVGMKRAQSLNVRTSDQGIEAVREFSNDIDIVVDCTSAQAHLNHWPICKQLGKTIIDLTPAKLGKFCVPAIASDSSAASVVQNINLITCGGQTSIPIAFALSQVHSDIDYIEVSSNIASLSAGPATRQNLDEYIETTELALREFSKAKKSKAILVLNPADPPIHMQTTIYAKIKNPNLAQIQQSVINMVNTVRTYTPGYQLVVPPMIKDDSVMLTIKVLGNGDHLPQYAGNLDIINCAALAILERAATLKE
jgi:acetaldehyde dehydrogenase